MWSSCMLLHSYTFTFAEMSWETSECKPIAFKWSGHSQLTGDFCSTWEMAMLQSLFGVKFPDRKGLECNDVLALF